MVVVDTPTYSPGSQARLDRSAWSPGSAMRHKFAAALMGMLALCGITAPAQAAGPTGLLNDTGQTQCDNGSNLIWSLQTRGTV